MELSSLPLIAESSISTDDYVECEPRKLSMLSLGGCITHDISKKVECYDIVHMGHLWRRPTIPLTSKPSASEPEFPGNFPDDLVNYLQNDYRKHHFADIRRSPATVLCFDITRDIYCRVIEIEDSSFIVDPMSVKGIMWDSHDIHAEQIDGVINGFIRKMDFTDRLYFDCWKYHFHKFAMLSKKFDKVILNKIYFTNEIASTNFTCFGSQEHVQKVNDFLDAAYEHIRAHYPHIVWNAIPRKLMLSGFDVPWSGPMHTHFIEEASSLFAENVRRILLPRTYVAGAVIVESVVGRARKYEDLLKDRDRLSSEQEGLVQRTASANGERDAALAARDDANRERSAVVKALKDADRARAAAVVERDKSERARLLAETRYHDTLRWSAAFHRSIATSWSWRLTRPLRMLGMGRPNRLPPLDHSP